VSDAASPLDPVVAADARRAIEAVLVAATEPVEPRFLAELVELAVEDVESLCAQLAADYEEEGRRFVLEGQHVRLSGPALETLAIVAYKQPVSRAQVSAIRGVDVETTLQTLVARGYVDEVGRDPGPGLAVLYGTTTAFLERLGLDSLDDLPPLGDFVPDAGTVAALERGLRLSDDPMAGERTETVDG